MRRFEVRDNYAREETFRIRKKSYELEAEIRDIHMMISAIVRHLEVKLEMVAMVGNHYETVKTEEEPND